MVRICGSSTSWSCKGGSLSLNHLTWLKSYKSQGGDFHVLANYSSHPLIPQMITRVKSPILLARRYNCADSGLED